MYDLEKNELTIPERIVPFPFIDVSRLEGLVIKIAKNPDIIIKHIGEQTKDKVCSFQILLDLCKRYKICTEMIMECNNYKFCTDMKRERAKVTCLMYSFIKLCDDMELFILEGLYSNQ